MEEIYDVRADLISEEYKEGVLAFQGENRPPARLNASTYSLL